MYKASRKITIIIEINKLAYLILIAKHKSFSSIHISQTHQQKNNFNKRKSCHPENIFIEQDLIDYVTVTTIKKGSLKNTHQRHFKRKVKFFGHCDL